MYPKLRCWKRGILVHVDIFSHFLRIPCNLLCRLTVALCYRANTLFSLNLVNRFESAIVVQFDLNESYVITQYAEVGDSDVTLHLTGPAILRFVCGCFYEYPVRVPVNGFYRARRIIPGTWICDFL